MVHTFVLCIIVNSLFLHILYIVEAKKKNMKYSLYVIGVVLLLNTNLNGQQSKRMVKALEIYNAGEYFEAIDALKNTYEKITDKDDQLEIIFLIAECYRKINDPRNAASWYSKAIRKNYPDPIATLHYADMLKMKEEYEEAAIQYQAYTELVPDDIRGKHGIESCKQAKEWKDFPSGYEVNEMKFFNTKQLDFCPSFARENYRVVYLTSTRDESLGKSEHGGTGQEFSDIFESTMDRKGAWSTPVPLSEDINTEFEEGAVSFTTDFNTMYFTRCQMNKNKIQGCQIYESSRKGESWAKPKVLEITSDSLVVAHPAISPDELTLYFTSDIEGSMPDIKGEPTLDIWMVTRNSIGGEWGEPINLGEQINTSGDEAYPFVHADGTLYFASNGHIGMGGYDIFKATQENGNWKVENMGYPINSAADDFGITFEKEREAGFFSSSRKGRGDDIYAFLLPPVKFNITGVVRNKNSDDPIGEALVKMVGSDGMTIEATTSDDGSFKFMLQPATDYIFLANKKGFLQGKERETTKGKETSEDFETNIYLAPIDKPITVENIFFDFNDSTLRPESTVSLDGLVEILNDNPGIVIEMQSHTDSRGDDKYNLTLSEGRAHSVVNYLISKGIAPDRMKPKGYGETKPKVVTKKDNEAYPFLPVGQVLTESFINSIEDEDLQETAHFLNRRTEFQVIKTDY